MNPLLDTSQRYLKALNQLLIKHPLPNCELCNLLLFPPLLHLSPLQKLQKKLRSHNQVTLGAQNASAFLTGAYTGQISGPMLKEIDIHTVLIGHSECRQYGFETDQLLAQKAESLIKQQFQVLFCIGEDLPTFEAGRTLPFLEQQLNPLLQKVVPLIQGPKAPLTIAYEPIWAIGTGRTAQPETIQEVHLFLRQLLSRKFGPTIGKAIPLLYGGSVHLKHASTILKCKEVNGLLVGGSSLDPKEFFKLIQLALELPKEKQI